MLDVLTGYELKIVMGLIWQSILLTFNLDVRLSLFWALDSDEAGATLLIFCSFILYLVPEAFFSCKCWHWELVNLVYLHWRHLIEFKRSLD